MNATVELALTDNNTGESLGGCEVSVMLPADSMEDVPADVLFMNFAAFLEACTGSQLYQENIRTRADLPVAVNCYLGEGRYSWVWQGPLGEFKSPSAPEAGWQLTEHPALGALE